MTTWGYDVSKPLGSGGFGNVYEAQGPTDDRLAAKVVPKAEGATREQLIAQDAPDSPHVVPILHVDETPESFVLYMPRADYSLRDRMRDGISASEAIAILVDLAEALAVIAPVVVHRDIKPENVLYLHGTWALCDFGIARYADASTAGDTRKFSFTTLYAAPEQWRYDHATAATDVYAFGVIAYELLAGQLPFEGTQDQLREQHLTALPAVLPGNRKLSWIVSECLNKAPEARPAAGNLVDRLRRAGVEAASRGGSSLAAAQSAIVEAAATEQALAEKVRTERERRLALVSSARGGYDALIEELIEFMVDNAPSTRVERSRDGGVTMSLGPARLRISPLVAAAGDAAGSYDVVAYGDIHLDSDAVSRSRSHSLYFADFAAAGSYSWYELGFMQTMGADFANEPRSLPAKQGLHALSPTFGTLQLAYGVNQLDIGDLESFIEFWSERFGLAGIGKFPQVSQLPDGVTRHPQRRR
jgi:hypothetical protein